MGTSVANARDFVALMIEREVLRFGDFTLKSGRRSPYFFNLGAIADGAGIAALGRFYAAALTDADLAFDVLFGPAYKGIPLATATAIALAANDVAVGLTFNRKEAKAHGEGGRLVGHDLDGRRVVVVDDVLTAGTAVLESAELIEGAGGRLAGVVVALDRREALSSGETAVSRVAARLKVPVIGISTLADVVAYLREDDARADVLGRIVAYQRDHCVA